MMARMGSPMPSVNRVKPVNAFYSVASEWYDYLPFKVWSLSHGFAEGKRLRRKSPQRGATPDNCVWVYPGTYVPDDLDEFEF